MLPWRELTSLLAHYAADLRIRRPSRLIARCPHRRHPTYIYRLYNPSVTLYTAQIAEKIRPTVDKYHQAFPSLLEIPSKDHPYDPSKDSILKRVQKLSGD